MFPSVRTTPGWQLYLLFLTKNPPTNGEGTEKIVNISYFPITNAENFEYYLQLGTKRMPDHAVTGVSESWHRLQNALGIGQSLAHTSSISQSAYRSNKFMLAQDTEKLPMLMASGENLSTGQTIFLKVKNCGSSDTTVPRRVTICMHFEKIISVQDTITEVFE